MKSLDFYLIVMFSLNLTFKEGVLGLHCNAYSYNQPCQQVSQCSYDLGEQLRGVTDNVPRQNNAYAGVQLAFGSQTKKKTAQFTYKLRKEEEKKNLQKKKKKASVSTCCAKKINILK